MDTGIEVEIYRDTAPTERVAILEGRTSPQFLEELRNHGAGSFTISRNDPKIIADPSLLNYRNIVKLRLNGKVQGGFVIQTKKASIIGAGEESEAAWSISGEGLRSWFKDAIVYPALGLQSGSVETRYFNFASERGAWYNASEWITPVNLATVRDPSTDWGSVGAPAQWPDVPQASWVWSRGYDANRLMPKGFSYFRHEFTTTDPEASYSFFFSVDDAAELYVDGELVMTTDEHAWYETVRYDMTLTAGPHIIGVKAYNSFVTGGPAGFIGALMKAGNGATPTAAQLVSYTGQNTWKAMDYPANEPGWSVGEILLKLLAEAKARGVRFPNNITSTFTATTDSAGNPWDAPIPWNFSLGATYEEVLQSLEELACDVFLDPADLKLYAWNKRGSDYSLYSTDFPKSVTLRKGLNLQEADETGQASITNALILKTADGWREVDSPNGASQLIYGVIESQMATNLNFASSAKLTNEVFRQRAMPELSATYTIIPVPGAIPFIDFNVGDWVSAPESGTNGLTKRRVVSIAVTENEVGTPIYAIEFDTIFKDRQTELERYVQRATNSSLGGGFTNTTGVGNSVQRPKPQAPLNRKPKFPPNFRIESNEGYFANDNSPRTRVKLAWDAQPFANDGTPLSIKTYEVWNRFELIAGDVSAGTVATTSTSVVQDGWASGVVRFAKVRSQSYEGVWSDFSPEIRIVPAAPVIVLDPPTPPVLTTALGTVTATWDGKLTSGNPPRGFKEVRTERKVVTNGVTSWVQIGTSLSAAGYNVLAKLKVGDTETFRFIAYPTVGEPSEPSTQVSIKVDGIQIPDIDKTITDAIDKAAQDSEAALTTADGKNTAYYQAAQPSGGTYKKGDTWFDTDDGYRLYVYTGSGWLLAQDAAAADQKASAALTSADGKNTNYYSATTPTAPSGGFKTGDSWFDTANNNALRVWNGTAWILAQDSFTAASKADTALTTANGKNKVIRSGTQPSGTNYVKGDLWFNSADGNKMYEWSGSAWVLAEFGTNALSNTAITAGKLADSAVTAVKLANGAVDSTKLATAVNTSISTAQTTANNAQTVANNAKTAANSLISAAENRVLPFASGTVSVSGGWTVDTAVGRNDSISIRRDAGTGTGSISMLRNSDGGALPIQVVPGETYEIGGWYKTSSDYNGSAGNTKLRLANQSGSLIGPSNHVPGVTADWTFTSGRYVVPSNGSVTRIFLNANADNTAGQVWFDDVYVKNITSVVAAETIASGAQTAADAAKAAADAAKGVADSAKISADGKNRIYRQGTQPTGAVSGDTWFDTSNDNRISVYNGTSWVQQTFGSSAISSAAIDSTKLAAAVNTSITNAMTAATDAQAGVNAALMKTLNRVTDPSFGSGVMGGLGGGWSIVGNKGRSDNFSLTRTAQSGSSSVVLTQVAGSDNNTFLHIPVSPGQTWEIGGWVTTTSNYNGTNGNSKLRLADQNNSIIGSGTIGVGSPRIDWTWESTRYTVPNDTSVKSLRLTVVADNSVGQIWWDDVVLRDVTDVVAAEQASAAALASANGKNRTIYSLGDPSGQGTRDGDLWYKTDTNSLILGVWFWDDSAKIWNKRKIDGQTIDNLDAGTITVGFMNGNRIQANTIQAEKIMIGNFTNLIPDSTLQYPLSSGAWRASSGSLSSWEIVNTTGLPGQALHITKLDAWGEHRLASGGKQAVNPGEKYAIGGRSFVNNWSGQSPRLRLTYRDSAGNFVSTSGELAFDFRGGWSDYSQIVTIPNDATIAYAEFEIRVFSTSSGDMWVGNIFWRQATTGNLLVDGAIQAGSAIIAEGAIGSAQIGNAAITNAKIADAAITNAKIASLDAGKINAGTISGDRIGANTITGVMIQGATITGANMVAGTITAASGIIANAAIGEAKIIDGAITTAKIDSAAITNAKIANGAITDAKIANATILNASIADGAITNAKIANATITAAKITSVDAGAISTGFLDAARLEANSITADKILVGNFQNFITDPAINYPLTKSWRQAQAGVGLGAWDTTNTTGLPGMSVRGQWSAASATVDRLAQISYVDVFPNDKMAFGGRVQVSKTSGADPSLRIFWRDLAGNTVGSPVIMNVTGSWSDYSQIVTAPNEAAVSRASFEISVPGSFVGSLFVGRLFWRLATTATIIEDGAISTDKIAASAITAGKIAVGTITGDKVAANTISVSKLLVTSLDNLIQDNGFEYSSASGESWQMISSNAAVSLSTPRTGSYALRIQSTSSAFEAARHVPFIPVMEGDRFRVGAWIRTNGGTSTGPGVALRFRTYTVDSGTGTTQSDVFITPSGTNTTYRRYTGVFEVPSGTKFIRLDVVSRDTASSNLIYHVDDVEVFKMASAEMIVDGAVTADKIAANAVTAGKIAADAVTSNSIKSGAIDGMVITGALIQTNATNTGLKIKSTGLELYDGNGQQTVNLNATTGSALITGTYRNRLSGSRIQISSTDEYSTIGFYTPNTVAPAKVVSEQNAGGSGEGLYLWAGANTSNAGGPSTLQLYENGNNGAGGTRFDLRAGNDNATGYITPNGVPTAGVQAGRDWVRLYGTLAASNGTTFDRFTSSQVATNGGKGSVTFTLPNPKPTGALYVVPWCDASMAVATSVRDVSTSSFTVNYDALGVAGLLSLRAFSSWWGS